MLRLHCWYSLSWLSRQQCSRLLRKCLEANVQQFVHVSISLGIYDFQYIQQCGQKVIRRRHKFRFTKTLRDRLSTIICWRVSIVTLAHLYHTFSILIQRFTVGRFCHVKTMNLQRILEKGRNYLWSERSLTKRITLGWHESVFSQMSIQGRRELIVLLLKRFRQKIWFVGSLRFSTKIQCDFFWTSTTLPLAQFNNSFTHICITDIGYGMVPYIT